MFHKENTMEQCNGDSDDNAEEMRKMRGIPLRAPCPAT